MIWVILGVCISPFLWNYIHTYRIYKQSNIAEYKLNNRYNNHDPWYSGKTTRYTRMMDKEKLKP